MKIFLEIQVQELISHCPKAEKTDLSENLFEVFLPSNCPPRLSHPNIDTEDRPTSEAPRLCEADVTSCYMATALLFTVAPREMGLPGHSILPAV